jgi:hypothetical protein
MFLNRLISSFAYSKYLEIGIGAGRCLAGIRAAVKVGIDPNPAVRQFRLAGTMIYCGASDDFFRSCHAPGFFDLVFIDGWHEHQQVYRDVVNSLHVLAPGGTIVVHDCNPTTEAMQRVPPIQGIWTGDCWRAIVRLRMTRNDLEVSVLETDNGLGVIRRGPRPLLTFEKNWHELTWPDLDRHRNHLLGLIPISEVDSYFNKDR